MDEKESKQKRNGWIWVIVIAIIIWVIYNLNNRWTLMMCGSNLNQNECQEISFTMPDQYTNSKSCINSGYSLLANSNGIYTGFECGKSCKYNGNFWVCKETCNKNNICQ